MHIARLELVEDAADLWIRRLGTATLLGLALGLVGLGIALYA